MKDVRIGVVVVGRNECPHLEDALRSIPVDGRVKMLYVDSGSTDGSVKLATSMGVEVHALDAEQPFSAARARQEGVKALLAQHPRIQVFQFLDGDCELVEGWFDHAATHLRNHHDIGIVCGILSEKHPNASIYNWMSEQQWKLPIGEVGACGGVFMVRRDVYESAGGFDGTLLTREERDFCRRVRAHGYRIVRIDAPMARHDAAMLRFGQWWRRAVWGGYGDALEISVRRGRLRSEHLHRIRRYLTWPIGLPFLALCGLIGVMWSKSMAILPLACLGAYLLLGMGFVRGRLRLGSSLLDATVYSVFMVIRKFPTGLGFLLYFIYSGRRLKAPDPHAASAQQSTGRREVPAAGRWA